MTLLVNANALRIPLADESVHCVVTSPPYWSLRDYGVAGQLGLEATPAAYVAKMVAVFREVKRVLRPDGTCWVNLGDSYARQAGCNSTRGTPNTGQANPARMATEPMGNNSAPPGLKPKDLCGIPWRVALALQADGWWLRSDIIWHKPNPMPESVTDRPTKSHEYLFLLTKRARYFYDAEAIKERATEGTDLGLLRGKHAGGPHADKVAWHAHSIKKRQDSGIDSRVANPSGTRNRRTVWTIATAPYSGAHFATFPPALVEPCIKAGTSERGVCPICGSPWERVTKSEFIPQQDIKDPEKLKRDAAGLDASSGWAGSQRGSSRTHTTGWRPTCEHIGYEADTGGAMPMGGGFYTEWREYEPVPATVLDPFAGSGTTLLVARRLGRHSIGLDLSLPYLMDQARSRLELDKLDEWGNGRQAESNLDGLPMFAHPGAEER